MKGYLTREVLNRASRDGWDVVKKDDRPRKFPRPNYCRGTKEIGNLLYQYYLSDEESGHMYMNVQEIFQKDRNMLAQCWIQNTNEIEYNPIKDLFDISLDTCKQLHDNNFEAPEGFLTLVRDHGTFISTPRRGLGVTLRIEDDTIYRSSLELFTLCEHILSLYRATET